MVNLGAMLSRGQGRPEKAPRQTLLPQIWNPVPTSRFQPCIFQVSDWLLQNLVLLKVRFRPVQNGSETVRFGDGSTRLLNGPVWLRITVHKNMNRPRIVYKRTDLAREQFIFLKF